MKVAYMKYVYIFRHLKIIKLISLLILTLFLYSCGGGGGGGASGGGTSYTVTNCTDSGTDYQTYEYYNGGSDLNQNAGNNSPLQYVCASVAYARGATGDGIQVAVLDTGLNETHTEIDANFVDYTSGSDVVNSDDDASDDHGHGSHVAGIIAADKDNTGMRGVAYNATLYSYKIGNNAGSLVGIDTDAEWSDVVDQHVTDGIKVSNNSWGSTPNSYSINNTSASWINTNYYHRTKEWQYNEIKPGFIIENVYCMFFIGIFPPSFWLKANFTPGQFSRDSSAPDASLVAICDLNDP